MSVKVVCGGCGAKLKVAEERQGDAVICPRCRRPVQTPTPDWDLPEDVPAELPDAAGDDEEDWPPNLRWSNDDPPEEVPEVRGKRRGSAYSRPLRDRPRFWVLRWLVSLGYVVCAALFALTLIGTLGIIVDPSMRRISTGDVVLDVLLAWAGFLIWVVPVLVLLQLIDVFLAIEENTRR